MAFSRTDFALYLHSLCLYACNIICIWMFFLLFRRHPGAVVGREPEHLTNKCATPAGPRKVGLMRRSGRLGRAGGEGEVDHLFWQLAPSGMSLVSDSLHCDLLLPPAPTASALLRVPATLRGLSSFTL